MTLPFLNSLYDRYRQIRLLWSGTPLFHLSFFRPSLKHLNTVFTDLWPSQSTGFLSVAQKKICFYGEEFPLERNRLWGSYGASKDALRALHRFEWMRILRSLGNNDARVLCRTLIENWIDTHYRYDAPTGQCDIMGQRLAIWLGLYDFFGESADDHFRYRFYKSVRQQSYYLRQRLELEKNPLRRLLGIKGLILSQLAIPDCKKYLSQSMKRLHDLLKQQILADGTHYSRNPFIQLMILRDLIDIRSSLRTAHNKDFTFTHNYIEKMAPILRLFRHGDGRLAQFNEGIEGQADLIDMVLSYADVRGKPPSTTLFSGFERVASPHLLVLADVGESSLAKGSPTLSFETSTGRYRIIVNKSIPKGGYKRFFSEEEEKMSYSTVTFNCPLPRAIMGPFERVFQEGNTLISAERHWIWPDYILKHYRKLYLSAKGDDLRGQDMIRFIPLKNSTVEGTLPFTLTFHLYPHIKVMPTNLDTIAQLCLPNSEIWHFHASQNILHNEGIYLNQEIHSQISLSLTGSLDLMSSSSVSLKWALKRE